MVANFPHRVGFAWPATRWSWFAPALALLGMVLPVTGWQSSVPSQFFRLASDCASEDRESEYPGENDGDDSSDNDLEGHLLFRRSPREALPRLFAAGGSERLSAEGDTVCTARALHNERDAAALNAAPLPLRC
ncbi:MAG: hypothetical protein ACM3U2_13305 [Deltaproteobacteria bacterium]